MTSRGVGGQRRAPAHVLQAQNSLQASHRARLLQCGAGMRDCPAVARPPQLPTPSSSCSSTGYPARPSVAAASAAAFATPPSPGSSTPTSASNKPRSSSLNKTAPAGSASLAHQSSRCSTSGRGSSSRPHSSGASPHGSRSRSSNGRIASPCSTVDKIDRGERAAEDEEDFAAMLEELEALSAHLGLHAEQDALERRPTTGGTSASVSTTAHGGSSSGRAMSVSASFDGVSESFDEPLDDDGSIENSLAALSDNPFDSLAGAQRLHYELLHTTLPHGCRIETSPGASGQVFLSMDVAEGPYTPCTLVFWIKVFNEYPALGSFSVRCTKRIFHPSVDPDTRHVELQENQLMAAAASSAGASGQRASIAAATSSSPFRLSALVSSIRNVVLRPVDSPAVNADAAMLLQTDPDEFRRTVRHTLNGGEYRGVRFDRVLQLGKGVDVVAPEKPPSREMPDGVRVDLMKLEVMRDQYKEKASAFAKSNSSELRSLEANLAGGRALGQASS